MLNLTKTPNHKMIHRPSGLEAVPEINNLSQQEYIDPVHAANIAKNQKAVLLGRYQTLATTQIKLLLPEDCKPVYMDY